jgi:hypothetical protein
MKRKTASILFVIFFALSLFGCSNKGSDIETETPADESADNGYMYLDVFIEAINSYSDPPELDDGELLDYYKREYDLWEAGTDYTNVVIHEDGTYVITDTENSKD